MKKFLIILLALICLLATAACGGEEPAPAPSESESESSVSVSESDPMADFISFKRGNFEPIYEAGEATEEIYGTETVSVITVPVEKCSPSALEDWYFNFVLKTDYDHYLIKYAREEMKGCSASKNRGEILKNVYYEMGRGFFCISGMTFKQAEIYKIPEGKTEFYQLTADYFPQLAKNSNFQYINYGGEDEYPLIYINSEKCTKEILEDWYYGFMAKSGFSCSIIRYQDNEERAACTTPEDEVYINVSCDYKNGYFVSDTFEDSVKYIPSGDGKTFTEEEIIEMKKNSSVAKPLDFESVLSEINEARYELLKGDYEGAEQYCPNDPSAASAITKKEGEILRNRKALKTKESVSYEGVVEDIDLLFRALKNSYGAYYYFGGDEVFNEAKENILKELEAYKDKEMISSYNLYDIVGKHMWFLRDGHASFTKKQYLSDRHTYYYTYLYFEKQGEDFVTEIDGVKYTFVSCDNPNVSIKYTLKEDGTLAYSPVQFVNISAATKSDEFVLSDGKAEKTVTVYWQRANTYFDGKYRDVDFVEGEKEGIPYVSVRSFGEQHENTLKKFAKSGKNFKGSDVLIFDIRSNEGGDSMWAYNWVENFSGETPSYSEFFTLRWNKIEYTKGEAGTFKIEEVIGKVIPNDTIIIVLVDENCCSSGESMLLCLQTLENAIIVGSNSGGCNLCGNQMLITLPNSTIGFDYGCSLSFQFNIENRDFKGFEPDIWCDPGISLDAVIKMVEHYNLKGE